MGGTRWKEGRGGKEGPGGERPGNKEGEGRELDKKPRPNKWQQAREKGGGKG